MSSNWGRVVVSSLFVLLAAAASAEAAPTAEAALERYQAALDRVRLAAGDQGVYVETLAGRPLVAHNADAPFNPASVVKLATTEVARRNLGPDFRYTTRLPVTRSTPSRRSSPAILSACSDVSDGSPEPTTTRLPRSSRASRSIAP